MTVANFYGIICNKEGFIKMKKINEGFMMPFYIVEELIDYIELSAQGHCECMKWENIKSLLNGAKANNRLTKQQVEYLEKTYCRE